MMWPVITYLVLTLISTGFVIAKHGTDYKINAWATIIANCITLWLLYKGGFFNVLIN